MAVVPKPIAVTPSPSVTTRSVVPASRVASTSTTQVDALNEGTNISFDAAATGYQEQSTTTNYEQGSGRRNRSTEPTVDRLFTADSAVFAAILEDKAGTAGRPERNASQAGGTDTTVARIISTYEINALIISGNQPIRGTSLSFSL